MTHIKTGDDFDCPVFGISGCEVQIFPALIVYEQHLDERNAISSASQQAALQTLHIADTPFAPRRPHPLPTAAAPSGSASGAASSQRTKRRSRKRPSSAATTLQQQWRHRHRRRHVTHWPKVAAKMDSAANNKRRAATANPATDMNQQQSPPAASIAPSSSSCAGFDLFRDQLLRNTSIFAQQLGTAVPPPFSVLPMAHRGQQQMAAAAAHLFMQSFLMPAQQLHKNASAIGHNQNVANKGTELSCQ
ncbi:hypothetical protein niasHS_015611 [Heterodera schachtii]|uniref:Uncharacterized protein n=1 Tax=Heterodera schachtii TaxID=97005 RepID=A0ABD2HRV8_HETSC